METKPFEPADFLDTPESQVELLSDAFASGEPRYIASALATVAKARGVSPDALDRSISEGGDPRLSTLMQVIAALGFELSVRSAA